MTKIATLARTAVTATIAKRTVGRVSLAPVSSYTASSSPPSDAEAAATIAREDRHAVAKSKLKAFRRIVNDRVSARRFLPDTPVPDAVWNDILRMTRVRALAVFTSLFGGHNQCIDVLRSEGANTRSAIYLTSSLVRIFFCYQLVILLSICMSRLFVIGRFHIHRACKFECT
jgi:hypothetical protein